MRESDDLKKQFGRLFQTALSGAQDVADELRHSAHRIRERLNAHPFEQEKRELFARLGEETYELYKKGREQVPQILRESMERLDLLAGEMIGKETLQRAGDVVDDVVRGVVDEFNDFCEETIRSRQSGACPGAAQSDDAAREAVNRAENSARPSTDSPRPAKPAGSKARAAKPASRARGATREGGSSTVTGNKRTKRGSVLASDPLAGVVRKTGRSDD